MTLNKPLGGDQFECERDEPIVFYVALAVLACLSLGLVTGIVALVYWSLS